MTTYRVIVTGLGDALVRDTETHRDILWPADLRDLAADAWPLLVAVLAQPPGVVDRVAATIADTIRPGWWDSMSMAETHREWYRHQARAVLAALRTAEGGESR